MPKGVNYVSYLSQGSDNRNKLNEDVDLSTDFKSILSILLCSFEIFNILGKP